MFFALLFGIGNRAFLAARSPLPALPATPQSARSARNVCSLMVFSMIAHMFGFVKVVAV